MGKTIRFSRILAAFGAQGRHFWVWWRSLHEGKKLPRSVSGVRLGRLAVARDLQRQGLGRILLVAAMKKFVEIFNTAGGIGLFVDAKDQRAKAFYEHFGFVPMSSDDLELFLPVATIREVLAQES